MGKSDEVLIYVKCPFDRPKECTIDGHSFTTTCFDTAVTILTEMSFAFLSVNECL